MGFENGLVGLWDLKTGALLDSQKLHGPIKHLFIEELQLIAISEFGNSLVWDLNTLYQDYCELLNQVWNDVPTIWLNSSVKVGQAPAKHRCKKHSESSASLKN